MSVLTTQELDDIRLELNKHVNVKQAVWPSGTIKACINAALQAIEDWYETNKSEGSSDIDTATFPYGVTFTNTEKKWLFRFWMYRKYLREAD